jgi:NAD(P)-dependent dehydrogenase (short-subunit alcohol dehydrogenase family)
MNLRLRPGTARLAAMRSAVEALARELAPVRVNAVTPSVIGPPRLHSADGPERAAIVQNWAAMRAGRREGTADEVAQMILLLLTNDVRRIDRYRSGFPRR